MSNTRPLSDLTHRLGAWFERQKRVLPWRDEPTLYRVWISEIMLQQTQVATVVPYFERFIARLPTVENLAHASEDEVVQLWAGLGYYSRARNLHKAAKEIVRTGFPRDRDGWLALSGVGDYTAGAILSIALDQPEAILDGNVERVVSRLRRVGRQKGDSPYKARLWRLARALVTRADASGVRPSVLNQALMELGATVCTFRKPKCPVCPLQKDCRAFQAGDAESFPPKKAPKVWVQKREKMLCLLDSMGRVLLEKRAKGEWRAGLWDFPESITALEKTGVEVAVVETKHIVTRHKIIRSTRVLKIPAGKSSNVLRVGEPTRNERQWVDPDKTELATGSAFKRSWQAIRERLA
jgi:A/G-specific adenine glycosylase